MTRLVKKRNKCDSTHGSIRPVDNSDKPSYGFTGGPLSDRSSVTWTRPVTDPPNINRQLIQRSGHPA